MGDVVELDDYRPHEVTRMLCPLCLLEHISVHPVGCRLLECPCGHMIPREPPNMLPLEQPKETPCT